LAPNAVAEAITTGASRQSAILPRVAPWGGRCSRCGCLYGRRRRHLSNL